MCLGGANIPAATPPQAPPQAAKLPSSAVSYFNYTNQRNAAQGIGSTNSTGPAGLTAGTTNLGSSTLLGQ